MVPTARPDSVPLPEFVTFTVCEIAVVLPAGAEAVRVVALRAIAGAVPGGVKVTGASPLTVAVSVFAPPADASVQDVTAATPALFVVVAPPTTVPVPANVT